MFFNIIFFLFKLYLNFPIYHEIKRNTFLTLYFESSKSQVYAFLNYSEDFEKDDKDKLSIYYYLLIDKKLNVTYNFIDINDTFPNETEFNKDSYSYCNGEIINFNEEYKIIRYYKPKNDSINIFVFYLSNSSIEFKGDLKIKKLSFPIRLTEDTKKYLGKPNEIQIYFSEVVNISNFMIFYISPNGRFSLFTQKNPTKNGFEKKNYFGDNPLYKLYEIGTIFYKQSIIIIYYNPTNKEEKYELGFKLDKEEIFNEIYLPENEYRNLSLKCYKKKIFIMNSNTEALITFSTRNLRILKFYNDSVKSIEDLNELSHYKNMNDNSIYVSSNYSIFYLECDSIKSYVNMYFNLFEEKSDRIYMQNFTSFKILKHHNLTFSLYDKNNKEVILKLLSNNEGKVEINKKDYIFKSNEINIINLDNIGKLNIFSKDNNLNFIIKSKIPNKFTNFIDLGEKYILDTKLNENFIIIKINNINEYDFLDFETNNFSNSDVYYYEEFGYKNLNEIGINIIENYTSFSKEIDLNNYKTIYNKDNTFYQLFYFYNITNNTNIIINSSNKKQINLQNDKYVKLEEKESLKEIYVYHKSIQVRFFIIPCSSLMISFELGDSYSKYNFNSIQFKNLNIEEGTKMKYFQDGYLAYHIYEKNEYGYSYDENCTDKIYFYILNNTHFRYSFSNFSNATDINYILIIIKSENEKIINSICDTFENLYMNPIYEHNSEIYKFSQKDIHILINQSNCSNNSYIDLSFPKNIKLKKNNTSFIIRSIGITGPLFHDVKIYDKFKFTYIGEDEKDNDESYYYILIFVFFFILILIIIGIIYYRRKNSNNALLNNLISENDNKLFNQ